MWVSHFRFIFIFFVVMKASDVSQEPVGHVKFIEQLRSVNYGRDAVYVEALPGKGADEIIYPPRQDFIRITVDPMLLEMTCSCKIEYFDRMPAVFNTWYRCTGRIIWFNLRPQITTSKLLSMFRYLGEVKEIHLIAHEKFRRRAFAFSPWKVS